MQAHGPACKLIDLHTFRNILEHSACILAHSAYILEHSACIPEHSACIPEHSAWIPGNSGTFCNLHAFWNILELSARILEHSECIFNAFLNIMHAFWNILDVVEGCRKVDFQVDDGQTDIRTCWAASSQLKIKNFRTPVDLATRLWFSYQIKRRRTDV